MARGCGARARRDDVASRSCPSLDLASSAGMNEFKADLETIRRRAREKMEQGPITSAYRADLGRVIEVLNEVLATELVCVLRYKNHYFMASGILASPVASEFLEHAKEEQ